MTRSVEIVPYDVGWPEAFAKERDALESALGPAASAIHHVGSTAVPGLAAKPVIDIAIETQSLAMIDAATPALEASGYEARGEYGIPERRYFSRPRGPGLKVHLHVFETGHWRVERHLRFRDYLTARPDEAERYAELKRELAARHADDRDAYQAAKADFIGELQARASAEAREEG